MQTVKEIAQEKEIEISEYFDFENMPCYKLIYIGSYVGTPEQNKDHALLQIAADYLTLPYVQERNPDSKWAIVQSEDEYEDLMRLTQATHIVSEYENR